MKHTIKITRAVASDHTVLTKLMRQSKAHWGYSPEQMEQWQDELTVAADYIEQHEVYQAWRHQEVIGFYAYYPLNETAVKLDSLFIRPDQIGQGTGKRLLHQFMKQAQQAGFTAAILHADPNAEGFYRRFGFRVVGQQPTSIVGRYLPIMKKNL